MGVDVGVGNAWARFRSGLSRVWGLSGDRLQRHGGDDLEAASVRTRSRGDASAAGGYPLVDSDQAAAGGERRGAFAAVRLVLAALPVQAGADTVVGDVHGERVLAPGQLDPGAGRARM